MGGHGGLNILPQKRWNVYREDNKEKVRMDEEAAAKEEQLKLTQQRKCDAEFRLDQLRAARGLAPPETLAAEPQLKTNKNPGHINLFEGIKIFDPIQKSDNVSGSKDGSKRKKMKKEEEAPKVVSAENEKYRLGYGVAGKGVKLPWYLEKKGDVDTANVENGESEGLKSGEIEEEGEEKRSGKKSLAELREVRLKRERCEKEREQTLIEEQSTKFRNNHGSVLRDRSYSSWREDGQHKHTKVEKDRLCLSDLPDEILLHILSFLPTKSVVATSLLSRRWQHIWIYTPNLKLFESWFNGRSQFMKFTERVLLLRGGSSFVSFSLTFTEKGGTDTPRINTWITSVVQCNVEQLSLNFWHDEPSMVLPCCLFVCRSLVKLDLRCLTMRVPSMVCLPHLKHLELTRVTFVDNESAEKLLSHPLLEELIFCHCSWGNLTTVNVNSPKLERLSIDDGYGSNWSGYQVCFFGDNLRSFHYEGDLPPTHYCICGSTIQLSSAQLLVKDDPVYHILYSSASAAKRYCKLLNSLSRVQNLTLSDHALHTIYELREYCAKTTIPVFEHVTQLNITGIDSIPIYMDTEWCKMIFRRCPHLEHLTFAMPIQCSATTVFLRRIPSCFRTHMKKICIDNYHPDWYGLHEAIDVLLNSAPFLEEMVLYWVRDARISGQDSKAAELERQLNAGPKASENCKVSIRIEEYA